VGFALGGLGGLLEDGDTALAALGHRFLLHPDVIVRATATGLIARGRRVQDVPEFVAAFRRAEREPLNDARLAAVGALGRIAAIGPAERREVERRFLLALPRSGDYLVRRAAVRIFGAEAVQNAWGPVGPIETGRSAEDYRLLARRYVLRTDPAPSRVTIQTERGSITVELFGYEAPLTVDNFLRLVDRRYFDNGHWHRVVPNFVLQDGDPRGDGSGGPGTVIRDEINRRRYDRGTLGMALSGPDTGGSQFFLCHAPQPHLDGGYTVFGQVVGGWPALDAIVQGDRIRRIGT